VVTTFLVTPTLVEAGKYLVRSGTGTLLPIVFDSPHSGFDYPDDFWPAAPRSAVRTSCDCFVDELWGGAPDSGATLIAALFPRAYIDTNRSAADIDATMIDGTWSEPIAATPYTRRGMGLVRKYALPGIAMYDRRLTTDELSRRIREFYRPYRKILADTLDAAHQRHGRVWHGNCHSMKSLGNAMNVDSGRSRPDFVVSDCLGTTSDPEFTRWVAETLRAMGYAVRVNDPYQGGDLVATSGKPAQGRNSVQIEISRGLYLDESSYEKGPGFNGLRANLDLFLARLRAYVESALKSS